MLFPKTAAGYPQTLRKSKSNKDTPTVDTKLALKALKLRTYQHLYLNYFSSLTPSLNQWYLYTYLIKSFLSIRLLFLQDGGGPEVKKKLDEIRLLESRKSARLGDRSSNPGSSPACTRDFNLSSNGGVQTSNITGSRKRINSETSDISSGTTR